MVCPRSASASEIAASPQAHVEDVAAELALHDQGGQLGLGFADAPWRSDSLPEGDGFTAVGGFELKIQRFSHVFIYINGPDICQHS